MLASQEASRWALVVLSLVVSACAARIPTTSFAELTRVGETLEAAAARHEQGVRNLAMQTQIANTRSVSFLDRYSFDLDQHFDSLWHVVDDRNAGVGVIAEYFHLLDVWADVASDEDFRKWFIPGWPVIRLFWDDDARLRHRWQAFEAAVRASRGHVVGPAGTLQAKVRRAMEERDSLWIRRSQESLVHLMRNGENDLVGLTHVLGGHEKQIEKDLDGMIHTIVEGFNAVRPPPFLPERIDFDAEAARVLTNAAEVQASAKPMLDFFDLVKPAHHELRRALRGTHEKGDVAALVKAAEKLGRLEATEP